MDQISPVAWCLIGLFVFFIVALNLSLVFYLRKGNKNPLTKVNQKMVERVRNPWSEEDAQWQELSRQVEKLKKTDANSDDQN